MQAIQRVLGSLKAYRWTTLGALVSLLLLTVANALTPQLFRWGIDQRYCQTKFTNCTLQRWLDGSCCDRSRFV